MAVGRAGWAGSLIQHGDEKTLNKIRYKTFGFQIKMNQPIVFQGTVTQSGTMKDGHRFKAVQKIRMLIHPAKDSRIECEITRTEWEKSVDRHSSPSPGLPAYLNEYLSTFGACRERVRGVWCAGLMCLEAAAMPVVTDSSAVQWSPHSYLLIINDGRASGVAINREAPDDRANDFGRVCMESISGLWPVGPCGTGGCVD
jgi:hypothetical protein